MGWFRRLFQTRPNRFIELLIEQADYTVQGMEALLEYFNDPSEEWAREVEQR